MPPNRQNLDRARYRRRAASLALTIFVAVPLFAASESAAEPPSSTTSTTAAPTAHADAATSSTTALTTSPGAGATSTTTPARARAAAGGVDLKGSGSSFAGIEILQWQSDTSKAPYNLNINYQSSSSANGRDLFTRSVVDFAVSDVQYERQDNPPSFPFNYIPISAGGIAMMYNLKQVPDLRLSSRTICGIFTGAIPFWDDAALKADNPGKAMPHVKVIPVMRGPGAGTNFVMEEYCLAKEPGTYNAFIDALNADPKIGRSYAKVPTSEWPQFSGEILKDGSDGVAQAVADPNGAGAITAVETGYATQRSFPVAAVKNHDGAYVKPTEDSVTAALGYATQRDNGTHVLNFDGAGSNVYNPSSYSYLLARLDLPADKGAALGLFANYSLTFGQQKAVALGYAELGRSLEQFGLDQVKRIPGAPAPTKEMLDALTPAGKGVGELPGGGNTVNPKFGAANAGTQTGPGAQSGIPGAPGTPGGAALNGAGPNAGTSLDPSVAALGKTGGEQGAIALLGLALLGGGEVARRRWRRRA